MLPSFMHYALPQLRIDVNLSVPILFYAAVQTLQLDNDTEALVGKIIVTVIKIM